MTELLSILPNLSIGVISILALVYVTINFTQTNERRAEQHERAMSGREEAFRALEKEVRGQLLDQLNKNTQVMERVIDHLRI